ncbi:MAG: 30S ribosomal protein S6 [Opitutales bacterium]|nr:30S ribosomal protein S6 [Opitutales bacterium]
MNNKRSYRASFILDLRGYSDPIETIFDKLKNIISGLGGEINDFKNLGQKEFQYAVDKKYTNGTYIQVLFSALSGVPAAIKEKLKLDKTINRIFIEVC